MFPSLGGFAFGKVLPAFGYPVLDPPAHHLHLLHLLLVPGIFLINFHAPNHPIRILEYLRVILHVLLACGCFRATALRLRPRSTGPVTAKRDVEDDIQVFEIFIYGAAFGELRHGHTPFRRVGFAAVDIGGNLGAMEMVDADLRGCP